MHEGKNNYKYDEETEKRLQDTFWEYYDVDKWSTCDEYAQILSNITHMEINKNFIKKILKANKFSFKKGKKIFN